VRYPPALALPAGRKGQQMKYAQSTIDVTGPIWWPAGSMAATTYNVSSHDVENMRDDDGQLTRESVSLWLDSHAGDFQHVADFSASLEVDGNTVDIPWQSEDSGEVFADCMWPDDDDSDLEWIG
jgi:hypothetical protein